MVKSFSMETQIIQINKIDSENVKFFEINFKFKLF